jgi:hypothetical protein
LSLGLASLLACRANLGTLAARCEASSLAGLQDCRSAGLDRSVAQGSGQLGCEQRLLRGLQAKGVVLCRWWEIRNSWVHEYQEGLEHPQPGGWRLLVSSPLVALRLPALSVSMVVLCGWQCAITRMCKCPGRAALCSTRTGQGWPTPAYLRNLEGLLGVG